MEQQLTQIRNQIDQIDDQMLLLLNQRMQLVRQVGELKRANNAIIYRPEREKAILDRLNQNNNGLLNASAIESIFNEIFAVSRHLELPERVAFLGPEGSFSHQAAESRFGAINHYVPLGNIQSVFESVTTGRVRFGVVPIENNREGSVSETIDMLGVSDIKIVSEIPMNIHFTLAAEEDRLDKIQVIYSKDIAFKQCSKFIQEYFGTRVELVPVSSTSKAAQLAKEEANAAAICSPIAAKLVGLPILFENIEDSINNRTRFLVISKDFVNKKGTNNKTTVIAKVLDQAGSLASLLQDFSIARINLFKIESRPLKEDNQFKSWFLIDFEGHFEDENVKYVLNKNREQISWLGSYVQLC